MSRRPPHASLMSVCACALVCVCFCSSSPPLLLLVSSSLFCFYAAFNQFAPRFASCAGSDRPSRPSALSDPGLNVRL